VKVPGGGGATAQLQKPIHRGTFSFGSWSAAAQRRSHDVIGDVISRISPTDEDDQFNGSVFTRFKAVISS